MILRRKCFVCCTRSHEAEKASFYRHGAAAPWRRRLRLLALGLTPKEAPFRHDAGQHGNITQVVSSTGTLQAVVTVQVGSQVSGTIDKLFANFNTKVNLGRWSPNSIRTNSKPRGSERGPI